MSQAIKKLRRRKKITQDDLAKWMGVSRQAVAMWETGKRELKAPTLKKIAQVFGVKVDDIIAQHNNHVTKKGELMAKKSKQKKIDFELVAPEAKKVVLTGDFNAWDEKGIDPREKAEEVGVKPKLYDMAKRGEGGMKILSDDLSEYKRYASALSKVKNQMDEINLFNARLAGASDLMRRVTLTKEQKESVVEHMDGCRTVGEVKRAHRMMLEGYRARTVKKQRVARPNVQSVISEATDDNKPEDRFARMNQLAGL